MPNYIYFVPEHNGKTYQLIQALEAAGREVLGALKVIDADPNKLEVAKIISDTRWIGLTVLPILSVDMTVEEIRVRHETRTELLNSLKPIIGAAMKRSPPKDAMVSVFEPSLAAGDIQPTFAQLLGNIDLLRANYGFAELLAPTAKTESKDETLVRLVAGQWVVAVPGLVKRRGKETILKADFVPPDCREISAEDFHSLSIGLEMGLVA